MSGFPRLIKFFEFDLRMGFLLHSPETSDASKTQPMANTPGRRSMSKLKIARFNVEWITGV